jgi:hypothetical protein
MVSISFLNFLHVPARHMELPEWTIALWILFGTQSTIQGGVSLLLRCRLHYFWTPSELFCEKNYLKFSLQFPAAHMGQLLDGRCFLNSIPIAMITGAKGKSGHYLSFALRFCSFRLYPQKKSVPVSVICCNFYDSNLATLLTWPFFGALDQIWTKRWVLCI